MWQKLHNSFNSHDPMNQLNLVTYILFKLSVFWYCWYCSLVWGSLPNRGNIGDLPVPSFPVFIWQLTPNCPNSPLQVVTVSREEDQHISLWPRTAEGVCIKYRISYLVIVELVRQGVSFSKVFIWQLCPNCLTPQAVSVSREEGGRSTWIHMAQDSWRCLHKVLLQLIWLTRVKLSDGMKTL